MLDWNRQQRGMHSTVALASQELTAEQKQQDAFEAHRHRVFSVSYYMTSSEREAENILTGTFVQAFTACPEPDAAGVDKALLAELQRRFTLAPTEAAEPVGGAGFPRGQIRRTDLEEAVGMLPCRERLVFLLRDVEGYPPMKIAVLLNCPETEIHRTLLSARIRMRNALAAVREASVPAPAVQEMVAEAAAGG